MIKVTNLQEMNRIENGSLQMHIQEKAEAMMQKYQVEDLNDIGCFVILEKEEFACVPMNELEFVESYLHGVRIIDDSYGEDIYLPVEVVTC